MTAGVAADLDMTPLSDDDLSRMLLIRHFEQAVLGLFAAGEIAGTVHTCLGQEYIPVALAPLIAGDFVFSNHRGHGHFLALHADPASLLAEILGRQGALCAGVGGSQHLYVEDSFLATGVQGESLPVAVGVALAMRTCEPPRMAVAFIGDGSWGEGAVYEALNMAALWQVPLLVVVENNRIAQSTPVSSNMAGDVEARVRAFGIGYQAIISKDVSRIREDVASTLASARRDRTPLVLEFVTDRLGPHSKGDDTRSRPELERLEERDWARSYALAFPDQFARIDAGQRAQVERLVSDVRGRALSTWEPW